MKQSSWNSNPDLTHRKLKSVPFRFINCDSFVLLNLISDLNGIPLPEP